MVATNFDQCLAALLVHEGGNDDDPRDPGGRTSRGITQSEYDVWRTAQGLTKRDVWTASDAEVRAIYYTNYWGAVRGDDLPSGVDYCVFDYAVNSGVSRSSKALQAAIGATQDGAIGSQTLAATRTKSAASVITAICDSRLTFLQGLSTWATFGRGWSARVSDVRAMSLQMATGVSSSAPPPTRQPDDPGPIQRPAPPPQPTIPPSTQIGLAAIIAAIVLGLGAFWQHVVAFLQHLFH